MKKTVAILLALALTLTAAMAMAEPVKVRVGVVGENNDQWEQVIIPEMAKEGIQIELVKFSDYTIPNQALADKEVDMNAFQHYNFMNNWSKEHGVKLTALCETLIAPLCVYSLKYKGIEELKAGDGIAIMNDVVNEARALRMLEAAKLITLREDITELATVADIVENPLKLEFFEMEAALTASALSDPAVAVGFLNGTHAKDAGFVNDQALLREQYDPNNPDMHGIINVIAVRDEDIENEIYLKIAKCYQSDAVKALFETVYKGVYEPAW